ncbi:MlaA family lipoprotein [Rickettsiales endosymbiont of Stachyamoeba lipophora]|uniref:MlaA family lipoprotein n=1 Tax=Rickettsiales endosymbiont of Stachyamoeba lipophora TaxID=2486578 RepID=UPI0013DE2066|nr:VacJ family lipoprotein [Rickettsiales endosymbiont of Stachyamoeba lipophora]
MIHLLYANLSSAQNSYEIYNDVDNNYDALVIHDPFEKFNRKIHNFNKAFDKTLLAPITNIYDRTIPVYARKSLNNALTNLREPIYFVNHSIQFSFHEALQTFWRFFFNSTLGIAGMHDFAGTYLDLPAIPNDFEYSLSKLCIAHGPYIVLPLFGGSSVRGGVGKAVDTFADPVNYLKDNSDWLYAKGALTLVNFRSTHGYLFEDLTNLSVDDYAMVKSIYSQKILNRANKIKYCNKKRVK